MSVTLITLEHSVEKQKIKSCNKDMKDYSYTRHTLYMYNIEIILTLTTYMRHIPCMSSYQHWFHKHFL